MSNTEITEAAEMADETETQHEKAIFGEPLRQAREAKGYSLAEAAKATRLAEYILDAIECSDLDRLPPPTFVQGYLRAYARYLGVSEQAAVDSFNSSVPYKRESELHPRLPAVDQTSSHSPLIRSISIVLVLVAVLTVFYGAYDYYVKTAETIGQENASALARERAEANENISTAGQHTIISEDGELIVVAPEATDDLVEESVNETQLAEPEVTEVVATPEPVAKPNLAAASTAPTPDLIEMQAYGDSWVEINDAANRRLYHDLLKNGQVVNLKGLAPFSVFLGNAPAIELQVNKTDIKIYSYIRANSVARFSVSAENGSAVFH